MLITPHFVFVHQPKTGGTFVREILRKLYRHRTFTNRVKRKLALPGAFIEISHLKHFGIRNIPNRYKHLPVLSMVRNPFDRYVSIYEFEWWKRTDNPHWIPKVIQENYPNYPHFKFDDFLKIYCEEIFFPEYNELSSEIRSNAGFQTKQLLSFFVENPSYLTYSSLKDSLLNQIIDLKNITFLETENLNKMLYRFLLEHTNFNKMQLSFILDTPKIFPENIGRNAEKEDWKRYFSKGTYDYIAQKEELFLRYFPQYREDFI